MKQYLLKLATDCFPSPLQMVDKKNLVSKYERELTTAGAKSLQVEQDLHIRVVESETTVAEKVRAVELELLTRHRRETDGLRKRILVLGNGNVEKERDLEISFQVALDAATYTLKVNLPLSSSSGPVCFFLFV